MNMMNLKRRIWGWILKIVVRLEPYINKTIRPKIFLHDSNFYIIRKIRESRFKAHFMAHPEAPSALLVEVTSGCNASCVMCRVSDRKADPEIIDNSLFKRIINEWAALAATKEIWLNWVGEPTLDPNIVEKIRLTKRAKKNSFVEIFSNASLLNEALSKEMIEAGLDRIIFSIDGCSKETFEAIRRGLNFENVVANVNNFIALRNKFNRRRPIIEINFLRTNINIHEEEQFKKEWGPKVDNLIVDAGLIQHQEYAPDIKLSFYKNKPPCPVLWVSLPIFVNGLVGLCGCNGTEDFIVGDLKKQSISEIWNSETFKRYRRYHLEGRQDELHLCDKCSFWKSVRSNMPWYGNF